MNVFCENGWLTMWDALVAAGKLDTINLFKNNHVPAIGDTVAAYTVANFSGYTADQALTWGAAFVNGATQGEIDADEVTWNHNGGGTANTIYGIYVTDPDGDLIYAERFDAPISMSAATDEINYTPRSTVINQ